MSKVDVIAIKEEEKMKNEELKKTQEAKFPIDKPKK